jgi:hypothetical protein
MPFVLDAFIAACWAFDDHLVAALALERVRTDRRREAQGVYKGRPPSIDATKVAALKA